MKFQEFEYWNNSADISGDGPDATSKRLCLQDSIFDPLLSPKCKQFTPPLPLLFNKYIMTFETAVVTPPAPSTEVSEPVQTKKMVATTSTNDNEATNQDDNNDDEWKPPSQRISKEELKYNHQHNVRYPEEWAIDRFQYGDKVNEPRGNARGKTVYLNHKDVPNRMEKYHVITSAMRVSHFGEKIKEETMESSGFKIMLTADENAYYQPGNDDYNFVKFAEALDKRTISEGYKHRTAWFPGQEGQGLEEERDVSKIYRPIVNHSPFIDAKKPEYNNPWVDEDGNEVDAKFEGPKHRKKGPNFFFTVGKPGGKDATGRWVRDDSKFDCEFLDGHTGETIDITPDTVAAYKENNKGIKARIVGTFKNIRLLNGKFSIQFQAASVYFYPSSSSPESQAEALPRGIGLSIPGVSAAKARKSESAAPVEDVKTEAAAEPTPSVTEAPMVKSEDQPNAVLVNENATVAEEPAVVTEDPPKNNEEYLASLNKRKGESTKDDEKRAKLTKRK